MRQGSGDAAGNVWAWRLFVVVLAGLFASALAASIDEAAIRALRGSDSELLALLRSITDIALVQWYLVPAAALLVLIGSIDWRRSARHRQTRAASIFAHTGFAFAAIGGAQLATRLLKFVIGRARPELLDDGGAFQFEPFATENLHWSLPSGHATTCGAVAIVLSLWFPRWRIPAFALGATIAASRVAADAHYPSDVVAGFTVGVAFAILLARWCAARRVGFRFAGEKLLPEMRIPASP